MEKEKLRVAVEVIQSDGFTDYLAEAFPREEQLLSFLTRLIIPIATHAHASPERRKMFFELCQTMGIHFLGAGFYSPVPTTSELGGDTWSRTIPVHLDDPAILHFMDAVTPFAAELSDVPDTGPDGTFFWKNPTFGVWDASLYYSRELAGFHRRHTRRWRERRALRSCHSPPKSTICMPIRIAR